MSCTNSVMRRVWRTWHLWVPVIILACCCVTMIAPVTAFAQDQDVWGPPDDPYTPAYPVDLSASTPSGSDAQKGAGIPQTIDAVNITSIDPSNFPEICTFVEVLDEQGNPIPGLSLDSFCVRQDIYDIDSFSVQELKEECPTSICLVLDVSGSMLFEGKIDSLKSAAHQFVNNMDVYDRVAIVKFSSCYTIVQDFTSDKALLHTKINTLGASGRTAALDGIYQGVQLTVPEVGSKAVIALSDGMENNSFYCDAGPDGLTFDGFADDSTLIVNLANGSSIPVYTIALGSTFDPHYLQAIANSTGAAYYHAPTGADIAGIYNSIKFRICSRYLICYTSPDTILNGDCHDVIICRQDAVGACTVCDTGKYCEPNPPKITINLEGCQRWNEDVQLCATVTDSDTPPESLKVRLFYRNSVVSPFTDVLMTHQGGTTWCATIPKSYLPCGGDPVQYYVTASDGISTVAEPSTAPVTPAQFEICPNTPPRCIVPNDTTISLCTIAEVCLPVGCVDVDGNLVTGYPQQISGPGSLVGGNWCYTPSGDGTVSVSILCVDSCGAQSECSFDVNFQVNEGPVCHFQENDTTIFLCEPKEVCFPYYGEDADQNLDSCRIYVSEVDKIVPQGDLWCYTPKGDETVTFTMRCWDKCGQMCEKSFTATFVINKDPMCNVPNDTTIFLCEPQYFCLPFEPTDPDGNFAGCETWSSIDPTKSSNSGYSLCANITKSGQVTFYADCADQCGAHCFDSTVVNFIVNSDPVCQYQYDTTIVLCESGEVCLPVGCTDAEGNLYSGPTLIAGPGTISNGMWCYTPVEDETVNFTYECKDSCGATCQTESVIDFKVNRAPLCDPNIVAPTPCPPYDYSFNFVSTDPDGDTLVCSNVNPNAVLGQGTWTYPNVQRGERVVDTITCTDPCGATCIIPVDITFPDPQVPVCSLPNDTTIVLCDYTEVCLPVSATEDARCRVVDGVGAIADGYWCFTPTNEGTYNVYVECITVCDTCRGSFAVTIEVNDPPTCQPRYDTTISLCSSEEVCLPVGCTDANLAGGPTLVSGPGTIVDGMWCYTPTKDTTIEFSYFCYDSCGVECSSGGIIDFHVNQGPTCDFQTPVDPPPCVPPVHVIAFTHKDPDGDTLDCTHTNPNAILGDGTWEYNPQPGEHVVDTIRCTDPCGQMCELVIDLTYPNPQPPICEFPGDTTLYVCELGKICVPVLGLGSDTCFVTDGPGVIVDGMWCYEPSEPGTFNVYAACATECDTCRGSFAVTVELNQQPRCLVPRDTVIEMCDSKEICLPVGCVDNDTALVGPTVVDGPGAIVDGFWCYTPTVAESVVVTIRCEDPCGASCETSFGVRFDLNQPPVLACPDDLVYECDELIGKLLPPEFKDEHPETVVLDSWTDTIPGNCPQAYSMVIHWTATDECGLADTCDQTIDVVDRTPPNIFCDECDDPAFEKSALEPLIETKSADGLCSQTTAQGAFTLVFDSVKYNNGAGTSSWFYHLTWNGTPPALSHFTFGLCRNLTANDILASSPAYDVFGADGSTGLYGIKWDYSDGSFPANQPVAFSFTIDRVLLLDQAVFAAKAGNDKTTHPICGPSLDCDEREPCAHIVSCDADLDSLPPPEFEDNCDPNATIREVSRQRIDGPCPQSYGLIVTWEATDACGNSSRCVRNYKIIDNKPPEITCPADTIVSCDEIAAGELLSSPPPVSPFGEPTVVDNCDPEPLWSLVSRDVDDKDRCHIIIRLGYQAEDHCKNISEICYQTITIVDTTAPTIVCPPDTTLGCDELNRCDEVKTSTMDKSTECRSPFGRPSVDDNCDPEPFWCLVSQEWVKEDPCESILRLGFMASDHCGNRTDTCFQLVTFVDTLAPEIVCPADTTLQCDELPDTEKMLTDDFSSDKSVGYPFGMPLVKDNCDPEPQWTVVSVTPVEGDRCTRILSVGYQAKDRCDNYSDTCFQIVTIVDTTGPAITCPPDTVLSCDELIPPEQIETVDLRNAAGPSPFPFGTPTAVDNCDPEPLVGLVSREVLSDHPCEFVIKIGYLAMDHCQNFSDTCFQIVTVVDTTSPKIVCPPDTTLSCDEFNDDADVKTTDFADDVACPFGKPTVEDNCDPRPQYAIVDRKLISDNPCELIFQIGYAARDRCNNFSDTCYQTITVVDTTAPEISCPADTTVSCDELERITSTHTQGFDHPAGPFGSPQIKDNCDPEPQWSLVDLHLVSDENCEKVFAIGFQGRDRCLNLTDTCYQYVTVIDTTAPSCELPADTAYFLCTADTTICRPVWATDNCDEDVECVVTNGVGSIDGDKWCFSPDTSGLYTVAVTCKDDCGNECSGEFHVAIRINTPPTVEAPPDREEFVCEKGDTICVGPFPEYDIDGNEDYNYVPFGWMNPPFVCFEADTSGVYQIICCTVDECGAEGCDTTYVTVTINSPPICHPPNDTTIFLCDLEQVCLPYSCEDPDGNLMVVDPFEKGEIRETEKDTFWCYTPKGDETLKLTVLCIDSCGAECQSIFYVTFVINDEPTCTVPNDTTIFLCGPEEVALPYSASDPNGNFKECNIVEGPGELINGFWTYTPEEPETVTVVVDCVDSCGAECRDVFTVAFDFNQPPHCEFDELAPPVCVPAILTVPIKTTDPEGQPVTCEVYSGVGEIVGNAWQWEPIPGTDTTVVIHCTDTCGAYCELSFDVVIPNPQPPICVIPVENQEFFFCEPTEITLPIKSISNVPGGATCTVVDGPGEIIDTLWHYTPSGSESFDVTVRCEDICGEFCEATFHVDVTINTPPQCECPQDQRFFQCEPTEVQVPVSATDKDGNFVSCEVVGGPGDIKDGYWYYTPSGSESFVVTIRCWDECETYCECSFNVTFDIDQPPICQLPSDTLIEQCNPTKVFLPVSAEWYIPFGGDDEESNSGDVNAPNQKSTTRHRGDGNTRKMTFDRDRRSENLAAGGIIEPYCEIISGPGSLQNGYWVYTPSGDEQVTVVIRCTDQCGKSCEGSFTVTFEVSDPPVCQYRTPAPTQCVPAVVVVPFSSVDPEGGPVECELISGPGELNDGVWQWTPIPGQTANVTIQCTDTCGDYCQFTFEYTAPNPQPPICVLPTQDQDFFLCSPQTISVPISHTGGEGEVNCEVISGPGSISGGQWTYNATAATSFDVTVECTDVCGSVCQGTFHVNVQFNRRPVCNIPADQYFTGCSSVNASVPVSATDPDGNLSGCEVISGPGQIVGGNWTYTATSSGTYNVTVRCTDQCGSYCEGTFKVTFDLNEAPQCQFDDTYYFSGCENVKGTIPLSVYDPDGNFKRCRLISGPGALVDGQWVYTSSISNTFHVVIECSDSCGAVCQADFDVTFDLNSPPICNLRDTTIIVCGPSTTVHLPLNPYDADENLVGCTLISGPGSIVGNEWIYHLLEDTPVDLVIRCTDECGMYCESSVHIEFQFGDVNPCSFAQDQQVYLCGPGEFCLDVPPGCDVTFGQGKVDGVDLCFLATEEGRYWALIECTDDCGNVCNDTAYYQVHFDPSLPNCGPSSAGTKTGSGSSVTSASTDPCACPARGDIDADGSITGIDLSLLARFISKEILTVRGTDDCPLWNRADINCDGRIDMDDITALQAYLFAGGKLPCDDCTGR